MKLSNKTRTNKSSDTAYQKLDKITFYVIVSVWAIVLSFAIVSIIQPKWLQNVSNPGRTVEAQTMIEMGNTDLYSGNVVSAINNYLLAIEIDPANLNANGNLGVAYVEIGDYAKAEEQFAKFYELDGAENRRFMYYSNYGDLYEKIGDSEKAFEMYSKAVNQHPSPVYELRKAGYYALLTDRDSAAYLYLTRAMREAQEFSSLYKEAAYASYLDATAMNDTEDIEILNVLMSNVNSKELENKYCSSIFHENNRFGAKLGYSNYYLGLYFKKQGDFNTANEYFDRAIYCFPALRQKVEQARKIN